MDHQLYGNKEFTFWPRGQEANLYPDAENPWMSGIPDIENVDLEKYPLYRQATPIKFVVGAVETLFIPFGIWQTAKSLEPTISVAFDLMNAHNFPDFLKDVWGFKKRNGIMKGVAATGYAALGGVVCRIGDAIGVQRTSGHQ